MPEEDTTPPAEPEDSPAKSSPSEALPSNPLLSLRNRVEKLFDDFTEGFPFSGKSGLSLPRMGVEVPALDVAESDEELEITAEIPGIDKEHVHVTIDDGGLVIKGEKREEKEEKKKDYFVSERSYGSFERRIPLPKNVDRDALKAELKKGVLKVTIPKLLADTPESRKIEISES